MVLGVLGTLEGGVPLRLRSSPVTSTASASRDYTVEPARVYRGRVLDPDGRPVADAVVEGYGRSARPACTVTTKTDGSFRLYVPRSGKASLRAWLPTTDDVGLPFRPVRVRDVPAGDTVDLTLQRGAEMRGRVTWWEGGPAAGIPLLVKRTLDSRSLTIRARTDPAGRFRVGGLFPLVTYRIELDEARWKGETLELLDPKDETFLIRTPKAGTYTAWADFSADGRRKRQKLGSFRGGESGVVLQIPSP
jgi:hypothetical protein